ncbi:MAG: ABC transporter substrate-binding protein [Firmicutes bacterium]|nr:ABC transporter substrate-binding protein [Bacillota bacterium]
MRNLRVAICALVVVSLGALQGCGSSSSGDIRVILAAPMTGNSAQWGESLKDGARMAVDEINAAGGVLGRKIALDFADDKGDPKEAVNVAQKIATDKDVVAVVGHFFTSCTMAASPVYQKAGIPEIAIASTHPDATKAGDFIFRVNVTNTHQGSGLVKWLLAKGKKKIAIIYVNDDYGKGISEIAAKTVKDGGGEVVYTGTVAPSGEQDFTVLLTNVKNANPDALALFVFYANGAQLAIQAKKLGLSCMIAAADGVYSPDFVKIAGPAAEGAYVATWFHPSSKDPGTKAFIDGFKNKYNKDSDGWAPYAYDAVKILAEAIKKAGKADRKAVRDQLAQIKGFKGATGDTTFTAERVPDAAAKKLLITVVKEGKFVLTE